MAKVIITGGTGLIGKALSKLLVDKGYQVIILSRKAVLKDRCTSPNIEYAQWDVEKQTIDASAIRNSEYIIHLAGAGIAAAPKLRRRRRGQPRYVSRAVHSAARFLFRPENRDRGRARWRIDLSGDAHPGPRGLR